MFAVISFVLGFMAMLLLLSGVKIIQPWEQGLWIVLGRYQRRLNPGFNFVYPLVSAVVPIDLRTMVLDVPRQEVITKDNSPTNVDALIYIKVVNPEKCYFEVSNYRQATIGLAQTTLRSIIGDMELDEVLYNRDVINTRLRDILDEATDAWGVKVEAVEIREVDPVGRVKAAMEEQTSAERQRRAAILKAEGMRQSAILEAEGRKQARILEAEGLRQARVLEAEGQRDARILESQAESQALRIMALGAAAMDQKALAVLSVEALKKLGEGPATKIVLPFEITGLLQGAASWLGATRSVPDRRPNEIGQLEALLSRASELLGPVPRHGDIRRELAKVEDELQNSRASFELGAADARLGLPPQRSPQPEPQQQAAPPPRTQAPAAAQQQQPAPPPRTQAPAAAQQAPPDAAAQQDGTPDKTEAWEWPKVLSSLGKKGADEAAPGAKRFSESQEPEFEVEDRPDITEPRFEIGDKPRR
jgi:regulator of protease activity HflC (stomatin/prohibitin superfamily)